MLVEYSYKYIDKCVKIFLDTFRNQPFNYKWMEETKIKRYFTDMERTPMSKNYIYLLDKEVVGVCFGVHSDYFANDTYEIKEIIISKSEQGKGIGTEFLKSIEKELYKNDIFLITLLTQKEIKAYEFYKKNEYVLSSGTVHMSKLIDVNNYN
jgi:aminoglycoside 6'-N-acetyltransferase I